MKTPQVKPSLYAHYFMEMKEIATSYGYNLALHGSMARDLDLILLPWSENYRPVEKLIEEFARVLGGEVMIQSDEQRNCFPHGRQSYVININRGKYTPEDPQYYVDISFIPAHGKSPKKIAYCGSLRVALQAFKKAEYESVLRGEIALLPCCMFVDIQREYGAESDYKQKADDLHKRKIDICDEVFVLNVDGYIGESTKSEIEYAKAIGKAIKYLNP